MRLGETDLSDLLAALERIRFAGEAQLLEGRFAIDSREYLAMEIPAGTRATFEADVSWTAAEVNSPAGLRMTPTVRAFTLRFDHAIVLIGRPPNSRRVTLSGATLQEGSDRELSVDVRLGRTIVGSLAQAIVGVPGGLDAVPEALAMISRIEVGEIETTLRAGAVLRDGESELHLASGSGLQLRRIEVDVPARSARLDLDGSLELGPGSCVQTPMGALCFEQASFELHGDYSRRAEGATSAERLRLTQIDRPTRLVAEDGTLTAIDGAAIEVRRASLLLERSECGGEELTEGVCANDVRVDLELGAGSASVEGVSIEFGAMRVENARLERAGEETRINASRVLLTETTLTPPDSTASLRFGEIELREVGGSSVGALQVASGEVVARAGEVRVDLGGTQMRGVLAGETTLSLRQRSDSGAPMLSLRAALDDAQLFVAEAPFARARGVEVDATLSGAGAELALRTREEVRVDPSALADVALADVRLGFRALRLVRVDGHTRFRTEGLRLSLPREQLLAVVRPAIPPSFVGDEEAFDAGTQAALSHATGMLMSRDLTRFRSRIEVHGFDGLALDVERGRLRMRGDLTAGLRVLANEHQVELATCTQEVGGSVPVPCYDGVFPSVCMRRVDVEVPYPCVHSEDVDATVLSEDITLGVDVSGEILSNAPASVAELELTARLARCDRIAIDGLSPTLQRLLDVRGLVCERLTALERKVTLASLVDLETSPLLAGARVERFRLDSDAELVHLELELDVPLD